MLQKEREGKKQVEEREREVDEKIKDMAKEVDEGEHLKQNE